MEALNFKISPSMGWETMKLAAVKGSLNYSGASGNCNIDSEGNVTTSYKVLLLKIQVPGYTLKRSNL